MQAKKTGKILKFSTLVLTLSIFFSFSAKADGGETLTEQLKVDSVYQEAKLRFDAFARNFYEQLNDEDLNYEMFVQGLTGYLNLSKREKVLKQERLTLIDFSLPSNEPRMYIIDMNEHWVLHKSIVSHGRNSGGLYAKHFSNEVNSHQSSIGFYVTGNTYNGKHKMSLRLHGQEYTNSQAIARGVVIHSAKYATYEYMEKNGGVLGRSYGCPALPTDKYEQVIDWIKDGTVLYIYYPSKSYVRYSKCLNRKNYLEEFVRFRA